MLWNIDQAAILALPAWKARIVRIALNRLVQLNVLTINEKSMA